MKIFLILILTFLFISCEKEEYLIPDREVPGWLRIKISQDEQEIKNFPQGWKNQGFWYRYNWRKMYYFEYHCAPSSSMYRPISIKGDTLNVFIWDITSDYYREKCCKTLVWKAPGAIQHIY